jgi:hypothetical protein
MKKPIHIKFADPPNHISEYLTHWTGRDKCDDVAFDILEKIVKSKKLKLSPCPNHFKKADGSTNSVSMVCFTETPIEQSLDHCNTFGFFGIGFDKQDMAKLGANPVLYIVKDRKYYQEKFSNIYWNELQEKWQGQMEIPFDIRNNLSWFLASTQPYTDEFNGKTREYYSQREWRIIRRLSFGITDAEIKRWGQIDDGFDTNEIKCEDEIKDVNGVSQNVLVDWLSFPQTSIKNIIVPAKYENEVKKLILNENLVDCDILLV